MIAFLTLSSLVQDPQKLKKLKGADFSLFTCYWWPMGDLERSSIAAYLVIWLFLWDDEIDESSGSLTNDMDNAQAYRARTSEFVEQCLGLKDHNLDGQKLHPFISSFEPIGAALRAAYTTGNFNLSALKSPHGSMNLTSCSTGTKLHGRDAGFHECV